MSVFGLRATVMGLLTFLAFDLADQGLFEIMSCSGQVAALADAGTSLHSCPPTGTVAHVVDFLP